MVGGKQFFTRAISNNKSAGGWRMVFVVLDTFIVTAALRSASCLPLSESFTLILCSLYHKMHSLIMQLQDFVQLS